MPSETQLPVKAAPGERERVATLSHPVPRGGVGEQSAPRPAPSKTKLLPEQTRPLHQKRNSHRNSFPHQRKTDSPPNQPPGERERVATLSHPVAPRSCRGAERPTPRSVGNKSPQKNGLLRREPISQKNSPRRAREGRTPLAPRRPRGVGKQSAPRPRRRKQKSAKEQPRESSRGCEPSRLPIEGGDLRVGRGC